MALVTVFNGSRFCLPQEARWAAFFEHLKIPYHYDPEGYDISGSCRFWLPAHHLWIAITQSQFIPSPEEQKLPLERMLSKYKPTSLEWEKADLLAIQTGKPVYLFFGGCFPPDGLSTNGLAVKSVDLCLQGKCAYMLELHRRAYAAQKAGAGIEDVLGGEDEEIARNDACKLDWEMHAPSHILALFYQLQKHQVTLTVTQHGNGQSYQDDVHIHLDVPVEVDGTIIAFLHQQVAEHIADLKALLKEPRHFRWELANSERWKTYVWCECPKCHHVGIAWDGWIDSLGCGCFRHEDLLGEGGTLLPRYSASQSSTLLAAYKAANQAHFL